MLEFLETIGNGSVAALWVPVLVWTGLAGAAAVVLRLARPLHPVTGYRLRQALLLALPVSLLATPWMPAPWIPAQNLLRPVLPGALDPAIPSMLLTEIAPGAAPGTAVDMTATLLGAATVAIVVLLVVRLKERLETMNRFADIRLTSRQRLGTILGAGLLCLLISAVGACSTKAGPETLAQPGALSQYPAVSLDTVVSRQGADTLAFQAADMRVTQGADSLVFRGSYTLFQPDRKYRVPAPIGTDIRYYPNTPEQEVLEQLAHLDVQIEYLRERMDEIRKALAELEKARDPLDVESAEAMDLWGEITYAAERLMLLKSLHTERVRMYETLKMEYETRNRVRGGSRMRPSMEVPLQSERSAKPHLDRTNR